MDDRAVSILENYELKIFRTWKGRGSILCETDQGLMILKEYIGPKEKVLLQEHVLLSIKAAGFGKVEQIIRNREEELISTDGNQINYLLKSYFEGKECNVRNGEECKNSMTHLAHMHKVMNIENDEEINKLPIFSLEKEYIKHNKELKKVKNHLKDKKRKTEFERILLKEYGRFYSEATTVLEKLNTINWETYLSDIRTKGCMCHGDYQFHNILVKNGEFSVVNFEKSILDSHIRDVYLFMRKVLEKNNWSIELGKELLNAYEVVTPLTKEEHLQLLYRFSYPDKFWKMANFYYNSGKSWLSGRNMDKLSNLLKNVEAREKFLKSIDVC